MLTQTDKNRSLPYQINQMLSKNLLSNHVLLICHLTGMIWSEMMILNLKLLKICYQTLNWWDFLVDTIYWKELPLIIMYTHKFPNIYTYIHIYRQMYN